MTALELTSGGGGGGEVGLGRFRALAYDRPWSGQAPGGDRFGARLGGPGDLRFFAADAPGHGDVGAAFWRDVEARWARAWDAYLASPPTLDALRALGRDLNRELHPDAHLCLVAGSLDAAGLLRYAAFGYGVHLLAAGAEAGAWWAGEAEALFGLKLGWVDPASWERLPRAFVGHEVPAVRRVVLLTDGFLGDDHRDPVGTLASVRALGARCAAAPSLAAALGAVTDLPHEDDDAAALALERA